MIVAVRDVDYLFEETVVVLDSRGPFPVNVTVLEDELAQEDNKTLVLTLELTNSLFDVGAPSGGATFIRDRLEITIVDANVPSEFTYRVLSIVGGERVSSKLTSFSSPSPPPTNFSR